MEFPKTLISRHKTYALAFTFTTLAKAKAAIKSRAHKSGSDIKFFSVIKKITEDKKTRYGVYWRGEYKKTKAGKVVQHKYNWK